MSVSVLPDPDDPFISAVFPKNFGIGVEFVQDTAPEDYAAAIDEKTKAVYIESIGNPKYNVPDIAAIAKVAHAKGVPLIVRSYSRDLSFSDPH